MTETSRFIRYAHRVRRTRRTRYVLAAALTLTGLLFPAVSAVADSDVPAASAGPASAGAAAADGHIDPVDNRTDPAGWIADAEAQAAAAEAQASDDGQAPDDGQASDDGQVPDGAQAPDDAQAPDETGFPGTDDASDDAATFPEDAAVAPRVFKGRGFDTCQAPDLATMRAWRASSPYRAVGIYFGGRARACKTQRNLTNNWVQQTTAAGWSLLPIYVGSQSPCVRGSNKNPFRIDPQRATAQGTSEGADAAKAAGALGMKRGSALYLDMEAYDLRKASCANATLSFVRAWDRQVRARGYVPGFYSSADSGIAHMEKARRAGTSDLPGAIWYARWGVAPTLTAEPVLRPSAWASHSRIHQYTGAVTETHGGHKLSIDRDLIDAPVAKL
ncbi:DUF1906 domain-containing protein [Streptomyces sp. NPDC093221]|uniref:DUF1906 domain-containing protein n=1 Tax=Streptomyces sp. NPDC093221 TaxID=3366032 RepID=UPI00382DF8E7